MQSLRISRELVEILLDHVQQELPNEACGILAGKYGQVMEVLTAKNVAANPRSHYEIDPEALARDLPRIEKKGLSLIGFYHSHPTSEPIPSAADVAQATFPDTAYMIVGYKNGQPAVAVWKMSYGQVERLELLIGESPGMEFSPKPLRSNIQNFTLIISGLLAIAVLLTIALTLLPPAPTIP